MLIKNIKYKHKFHTLQRWCLFLSINNWRIAASKNTLLYVIQFTALGDKCAEHWAIFWHRCNRCLMFSMFHLFNVVEYSLRIKKVLVSFPHFHTSIEVKNNETLKHSTKNNLLSKSHLFPLHSNQSYFNQRHKWITKHFSF